VSLISTEYIRMSSKNLGGTDRKLGERLGVNVGFNPTNINIGPGGPVYSVNKM